MWQVIVGFAEIILDESYCSSNLPFSHLPRSTTDGTFNFCSKVLNVLSLLNYKNYKNYFKLPF
jgi:hypothetical protein